MSTDSPPPPDASEPTAPEDSARPQLPSWHPSLAKREKPKQAPIPKDEVTGKFIKGHPGRPQGSRNSVTIAAELILIDEFERITRKCVEMALAGDPTALRICFDRLYPPRKGQPLPKLKRQDGEGTVNALLRAVLDGEVTPDEGKSVVDLIESAARVAAVQALGEARQQQIEVFKQAQSRGLLGAGVMIVPMASSVEEWEAASTARQAELKRAVRE